jgi:hypothetical protein
LLYTMPDKRSQHNWKQLVERAVADVCGLPRLGLWFCVDEVEARGRLPDRLTVWATLHFLPEGSPFCCGEPGCQLGLDDELTHYVSEYLRHAMHLRQELSVDFGGRIGVNYHEGVTFHYGQADA